MNISDLVAFALLHSGAPEPAIRTNPRSSCSSRLSARSRAIFGPGWARCAAKRFL